MAYNPAAAMRAYYRGEQYAGEDFSTAANVKDPRRAYRVVDDFERELCDYTGAPYAVSVNSCTNALFLALTWERMQSLFLHVPAHGESVAENTISLPRRTYIGVLQSVLNAGFEVEWRDEPDHWQSRGFYQLWPTSVWDFARSIGYESGHCCLSFHSAKQLPVGRGGAILTDNEEAAEWFRAARMDGRPPGGDTPVFPGWHMPMPPDVAARGLDILSRWNDKGYSPPPLPHEDYPDLSLWYPVSGDRGAASETSQADTDFYWMQERALAAEARVSELEDAVKYALSYDLSEAKGFYDVESVLTAVLSSIPLAEPAKCPRCFGKGLENQDDRPGIVLGPLGEMECRQCGGSGVNSDPT